MKKKSFVFLILSLLVFHHGFSQNHQFKEIPIDTSYTPHSVWKYIKNDFPEASIVYPELPDGVCEYRDLIYTTLPNTPFGKRELHLDLFQPIKKGKYPVLILIHGGGWVTGNKYMQIPMAQQMAAKGYITVTVEYQLAGEAKYPAAVHNIKAAIRWLRSHAEEYGIDAKKFAISGCSAGGQLATLVGMTNGIEKFEGNQGNQEYSSDVSVIINIDGVVDFLAPASLHVVRKPDTYDIKWFEGTFYEKPEVWLDASPIFWVNENSLPTLFLNSGYSRFHAGQGEMLAMLKQHNIYTEVHEFPEKIHPFWLFHPWFHVTLNYMVRFLDSNLK